VIYVDQVLALQETSIASGWASEFLSLAARFDDAR